MVNIWDPHFHIWDVSEVTLSGHDPAQLFAPKEDPVYTIDRYENAVSYTHLTLPTICSV